MFDPRVTIGRSWTDAQMDVYQLNDRQYELMNKARPDMSMFEQLALFQESKAVAMKKAQKEVEVDARYTEEQSIQAYGKKIWEQKRRMIQQGVIFF
ncbi:MAG: hypothetical protein AB7P76_08835 [Candidatus Melainabacteria bacterium]